MKFKSWQGCRVFVTGATGIVGSSLVKELLIKGAYVVALIHDGDPQSELYRSGTIQQVSVVNGSLEDFSVLERAINEHEIDTVFHLGAQTIVGAAYRSPLPTFEANIRGTYNLLEACRIHRDLVKRVVIASSDKAYGEIDVLPYTEDLPPLGRHPYDVSKSCTDLIAQSYYYTFGLPVVIARCGNIYGGGDLNWSRIIPGTIRSLFYGDRPIIRSDGTFTRDYVYVKDAVNAYMVMAEALEEKQIQGEAFNFGPKQPRTVLEIVDALRHLMGREDIEPLILNQAKAEIRDQYLSSQKAEQVLGWVPLYSLEKGLGETIKWYKQFLKREK
ncbi:GDP-mannose 4,6-dehydratase [Phormidium sp. LEGE 05292]|uniref:GDP-mannose 4,6-dehydratase n=1 Tax=[Phormidium] sp. LEGE 05292 TaxID=767427 RepID=UPI00187FBFDC|nr:GDP-mannose 4,6-dehydratase [Phormidium sp. LEGE 05292]MBE9224568.1 GDP-mannose 4,6-dehydratase [Phormidium sp. LEGE 05292]